MFGCTHRMFFLHIVCFVVHIVCFVVHMVCQVDIIAYSLVSYLHFCSTLNKKYFFFFKCYSVKY